jgi:hypothetical protein
MSNKLLISEQERKRILSLYGLITEAVEPFKKEQKVEFNAGYYSEKYAAPVLDPIVQEIKDYLSNNKGLRFIVNVSISSSESKIPNTDKEIKSGQSTPVEPKYLAKKRQKTIVDYLNKKFTEFKSEGIINDLPNYDIKEPVISGPEWIGTAWCKSPRPSNDPEGRLCTTEWKKQNYPQKAEFESAQNLTMSITINEVKNDEKSNPCEGGLSIRFEIENHSCQNAEFFVFANTTLLYNTEGGMTANLNTGSKDRGIPGLKDEPIFSAKLLNPGYGILSKKYSGPKPAPRWDDFTVTKQMKTEILTQSSNSPDKQFINIWFLCTTKDAHDDIATMTIFDDKGNTLYGPLKPAKNKVQGLVICLDKCGKPITSPNPQIGPKDVENERQKLIAFKENIRKNAGLGLGSLENLDEKGILLEVAGRLDTEMSKIVTKWEENRNLLSKTEKKNEENTKIYKELYNETISALNEKFEFFLTSAEYASLIRKDPLDSKSYPRKSLINDRMGGDIKARMNRFYEFFNIFYKKTEGKETYTTYLIKPEQVWTSSVKKIYTQLKDTENKYQ